MNDSGITVSAQTRQAIISRMHEEIAILETNPHEHHKAARVLHILVRQIDEIKHNGDNQSSDQNQSNIGFGYRPSTPKADVEERARFTMNHSGQDYQIEEAMGQAILQMEGIQLNEGRDHQTFENAMDILAARMENWKTSESGQQSSQQDMSEQELISRHYGLIPVQRQKGMTSTRKEEDADFEMD